MQMFRLREQLKILIKKGRLLPLALLVQRWYLTWTSEAFREKERANRRGFLSFSRQYARSLGCRVTSTQRTCWTALIASIGMPLAVPAELGLIKALEVAGFTPVVVAPRDPWLVKYYGLLGTGKVLFWDQFIDPVDKGSVEQQIRHLRSFEELLSIKYEGARVGRFAASSALRHLRVGSPDLGIADVRRYIAKCLADGMAHVIAAKRIVQMVKPEVALFVDIGYTPQGELFDICLSEGIDAITWNAAHRSNALILKRYSKENRDEHPASLDEDSWRRVQQIPWTSSHGEQLRQELYGTYASGDWYSQVGTQFNTRVHGATEIRTQLKLDPAKKTAIVFPHIPWDATFFWGTDLYRNYEEWFVETVRAACRNTSMNWVIKLHPGNVMKNVRDGYQGELPELIAVRRHLGKLPPHIAVIPADSNINTFSLFSIMDYCLTVRGTIGIEAAVFGIPVLTAGTGRYDRKGFTVDSDSREEYLARLARIHEIPPLSQTQRELAERFAYASFVLRPFPLKTITLEFPNDSKATIKTEIRALTPEDWRNAPDIRMFADWISDRTRGEFLLPGPDGGPGAQWNVAGDRRTTVQAGAGRKREWIA
jgi:hypothetical protein